MVFSILEADAIPLGKALLNVSYALSRSNGAVYT
jgi:hypothetical protein